MTAGGRDQSPKKKGCQAQKQRHKKNDRFHTKKWLLALVVSVLLLGVYELTVAGPLLTTTVRNGAASASRKSAKQGEVTTTTKGKDDDEGLPLFPKKFQLRAVADVPLPVDSVFLSCTESRRRRRRRSRNNGQEDNGHHSGFVCFFRKKFSGDGFAMVYLDENFHVSSDSMDTGIREGEDPRSFVWNHGSNQTKLFLLDNFFYDMNLRMITIHDDHDGHNHDSSRNNSDDKSMIVSSQPWQLPSRLGVKNISPIPVPDRTQIMFADFEREHLWNCRWQQQLPAVFSQNTAIDIQCDEQPTPVRWDYIGGKRKWHYRGGTPGIRVHNYHHVPLLVAQSDNHSVVLDPSSGAAAKKSSIYFAGFGHLVNHNTTEHHDIFHWKLDGVPSIGGDASNAANSSVPTHNNISMTIEYVNIPTNNINPDNPDYHLTDPASLVFSKGSWYVITAESCHLWMDWDTPMFVQRVYHVLDTSTSATTEGEKGNVEQQLQSTHYYQFG